MCSVVNYNILINDIYLKNVNVSFHFLSTLPCNTLLLRRIINGIVELFSEKKLYTVQWDRRYTGWTWQFSSRQSMPITTDMYSIQLYVCR